MRMGFGGCAKPLLVQVMSGLTLLFVLVLPYSTGCYCIRKIPVPVGWAFVQGVSLNA